MLRKLTIYLFFTACLLLPFGVAYGQTMAGGSGICERTEQIRNGILDELEIDGDFATECQNVSTTQLATISTLRFTFSGITSLKGGDFAGLSNLHSLDINLNPFTNLPEGVFTGLVNLQTLDLSRNELMTVSENVFAGLSNLQFLDLSDNNFADLPEGVFAGLDNLQRLNLDDSSLMVLAEGIFAGLVNLQTLDLSENDDLQPLPEGIFTSLANLQTLDLSNNEGLQSLPENVFADLSHLQFLGLGNSGLATLTEGVFAGLSNLQTLDLSRNKLMALPEGVFVGLMGLQALDLSGNELLTLPESVFAALSNLQSLNLSSNFNLSTLPEGIFAGLSLLETVSMGGNFFNGGIPSLDILFQDFTPQQVELNLVPVLGVLPSALEVVAGQSTTIDIYDSFVRVEDSAEQRPARQYRFIVNEPSVVTTTATATASTHPLTVTGFVGGQAVITVIGIDNFREALHPQRIMVDVIGPVNICSRTEQVRDAILTALVISGDPATACQNVGSTQLATINTLNFMSAELNTLQGGDFVNLINLQNLDLSLNALTTLPEDIFAKLRRLQVLNLSGNPFNEGLPNFDTLFPYGVPATLFLDFAAVLDELPSTLRLTVGESESINVHDAFVRASGGQTFPADDYRLTTDDSDVATATVVNHILTITGDAVGQTIITSVGVGDTREVTHPQRMMVEVIGSVNICSRTEQIRDAVLAELGIGGDPAIVCQNVGSTRLATISTLSFTSSGISTLQSGDFDHLTNLQSLDLSGNELMTLPEDIFAELNYLQVLNLSGNPFNEGLTNFDTLFPQGIPETLFLDITPVLGGLPPISEVAVGLNTSINIYDAFIRSAGDQQFPADDYRLIVNDADIATATVVNHILTITGDVGGQTIITLVGVSDIREVTHPQPIIIEVLEVSLLVTPLSVTIEEGKSTDVRLSLTGVSQDVTVTVTVKGEVISTLSLSAVNQHITTFTFVAGDDAVDNFGDDETVEYKFNVDGYESIAGSTAVLVVMVTDDDAVVTAELVQAQIIAEEGKSTEGMVEISVPAPTGGVTVVLTVANEGVGQIGVHNAEGDEPATSITVTVGAGEQTANFHVGVIDDETAEGEESYQIEITSVSDDEGNDAVMTIGTQNALTLTVPLNDYILTVSPTAVILEEGGESASTEIVLSTEGLIGTIDLSVEVQGYQLGIADEGGVPIADTISLTDDQSMTLVLGVTDDSEYTGTRMSTLWFESEDETSVTVAVTIVDDERAGQLELEFNRTAITTELNTTASFIVTATLTVEGEDLSLLNVALMMTVSDGTVDVVSFGGQAATQLTVINGVSTAVTINSGETAGMKNLVIRAVGVIEDVSYIGTAILPVEVLPARAVEISATEITLVEGESADITVSLNRARDEDTAVTVEVGAGLSLSADGETTTQEVTLPSGGGNSVVITVWSIEDNVHTLASRSTSILMTADEHLPNMAEVTVLEDDVEVSLTTEEGAATSRVNIETGESLSLSIAYQFPQVGAVQSEGDVSLLAEFNEELLSVTVADDAADLTLRGISMGESAVILIVQDADGQEVARTTLTVTVTRPDSFIFRIKVFLEGAQ